MGRRERLLLFISSKPQNFHSPKNWEDLEGMKLDLINFLLKLSNTLIYLALYFKIGV